MGTSSVVITAIAAVLGSNKVCVAGIREDLLSPTNTLVFISPM